VPITEKSNPLTRNLDKADAGKIVQLLGQCDAEIFQEEGQAMPAYQVTQTLPHDTANSDANLILSQPPLSPSMAHDFGNPETLLLPPSQSAILLFSCF
jgi:hypothetical protein